MYYFWSHINILPYFGSFQIRFDIVKQIAQVIGVRRSDGNHRRNSEIEIRIGFETPLTSELMVKRQPNFVTIFLSLQSILASFSAQYV